MTSPTPHLHSPDPHAPHRRGGRLGTWRAARRATYASYVVQASVNNLAPLLFAVFHQRLGVDVGRLGLLASINFAVQLGTDIWCVRGIDRFGYRRLMVVAHVLATVGLVLFAVLPLVLPDPFVGLLLASLCYAAGGGLTDDLASPIVEHMPAEPGRSRAAGMALLHSSYCWGQLLVVLVSTGLLMAVGTGRWWVLPLVWSVLPAINGVVLTRVPMPETVPDHERLGLRGLLGQPMFLLALALMALGGASELTMGQWSSFFAQQATGVGKEVGDLLGPGLLALLMALVRTAYGLFGDHLPLRTLLIASGLGASACYLTAATSSSSTVTLLACAGTGIFVALMWPGATSLAAARFPAGGGALFALLAMAGDTGATLGPIGAGSLAGSGSGGGWLSGLAAHLPADSGTGLRSALALFAVIPLLYAVVALAVGRRADHAHA